jgi:hypothetical protein
MDGDPIWNSSMRHITVSNIPDPIAGRKIMKSAQSIHSTLPIQCAVDEFPSLVEFDPTTRLQTLAHETHHLFVGFAFQPNFREHSLFHIRLLFLS